MNGLQIEVELDALLNTADGERVFIALPEVTQQAEAVAGEDEHGFARTHHGRMPAEGLRIEVKGDVAWDHDEHFVEAGGILLEAWRVVHASLKRTFRRFSDGLGRPDFDS